eukprot:12974417-Alexandrium_andersonii.AAC.1
MAWPIQSDTSLCLSILSTWWLAERGVDLGDRLAPIHLLREARGDFRRARRLLFSPPPRFLHMVVHACSSRVCV